MGKKSEMVIPNFPSYRKESKMAMILLGIVIILAFVSIVIVFFSANSRIAEVEKRMNNRDNYELVLDKETGTMVLAVKQEITPELRSREYDRVAQLYFENMYGFDKYTYEDHMEKAILLSGQVGVNQFTIYEADQIYSELVNEELRLVATIDSTRLYEYDETGGKGYLFGKQRFIKPYGQGMYNFIVEFEVLDNGGRTDDNVHGAIVEKFAIQIKERIEVENDKGFN